MNLDKYPWLADLLSPEAGIAIQEAKKLFEKTGAVTFPEFLTKTALESCVQEASHQEDGAFTTDDTHTAYLRPVDPAFDPKSVRNHDMRTQVASIAFDEIPKESELTAVYRNPLLRQLVARIVGKDELFLSDDPLGCCSINVFRPGFHHSFHFDESEFSTTLMLQEASTGGTGLFQYTNPLRQQPEDLALQSVASVIATYDSNTHDRFHELESSKGSSSAVPPLHTLEFVPGTLSIFAGSKSLHRVSKVEGKCSRLTAILTFASKPGFRNSPAIQKLFWGRSVP